jgi:carboxylate-amine ligase
VRGGRLVLRDGGRPIQVVYRRTDEDRLRDPDGQLTAMGELLLEPLRAGTLAVVNGFGTGVADDKRVYPYVDAMISFYLGEEPILPSIVTYDLAQDQARDEALERLDELVLKPRDGHGGRGVLIGPHAGADELREAAQTVRADPEGWCAQEVVRLSTHPTVIDGRLVPRHVDLRPFLFYDGTTARALPGGLTRVALERGSMIVNSSRNGGGKDTWVLP